MSRSLTVKAGVNHVVAGGEERDAEETFTVSNSEYAAIVATGDLATYFTDNGAVEGEDSVFTQAALVADAGALTSAAAAGGTPTKTEFDKTVADLVALRTAHNELLAALKGVGKPMAAS